MKEITKAILAVCKADEIYAAAVRFNSPKYGPRTYHFDLPDVEEIEIEEWLKAIAQVNVPMSQCDALSIIRLKNGDALTVVGGEWVRVTAPKPPTIPLYQKVNLALGHAANGNEDAIDEIDKLTLDFMPSGSGINAGIKFSVDLSTYNKRLVWVFGYHHMNEDGYYDGWTDHKLVVKPAFGGFSFHISGRNRNQVKDHLYDIMYDALQTEVTRYKKQ